MGKRTITRRRGSGTNRYSAPSHRYYAKPRHRLDSETTVAGSVVALVHSVSHSAPLALIRYEDGHEGYIIASDGMSVGDLVIVGRDAEIKTGNTLPLGKIPEGSFVYNIEGKLGDGGKFVRASGTFARIVTKSGNTVKLLMPSRREKFFSASCRATIGSVAGGGRLEKPFIKAGNRWHAMRARGHLYPITSAVAKNALNHPFGSGRGRHPGKSTVPPRWAPPGRNVGQVRARRTGRKK